MSIEELDRRLAQAYSADMKRQRLIREITALETDLKADLERLSELSELLQKELEDVDRLEGLSLQALFYTVLGRKERQLDKERQEYLAARLKHGQLAANVLAREKELAAARSQLHNLGDTAQRHEALLQEKARFLANTANGARLLDLAKKRDEQSERCSLIAEAISESEALLLVLDEIFRRLDNAESWGTWDLLGGGVVATALKHSAIDSAKESVQNLQGQLNRFRRVIEEADLEGKIQAEFSSFDFFADYFLDNLIMDWVVQQKIQGSLEHVRSTRNQVAGSQQSLGQLLEAERRKLDELERAWRQAVEAA